MDLIFMGTPAFALPTLDAIFASQHKLTNIVTMPDRPKGRSLKITPSPVKVWAIKHNIPVFQPENLKDQSVIERFQEMTFDTALVCAYGRIIPDWLLVLPKYKCINIHPSLLPRYRGPSPIESALLKGDKVTGTTIMEVTRELDSGGILLQRELPIEPEDDSGDLAIKLADISSRLVVEVLNGLEAGTINANPQKNELATYTQKFTSEDGRLDWSKSARTLNDQIRALTPKPGAHFTYYGKRFKIGKARVVETSLSAEAEVEGAQRDLPGTLLSSNGVSLQVQTAVGVLEILSAKPEGKRLMSPTELINGRYLVLGEILG